MEIPYRTDSMLVSYTDFIALAPPPPDKQSVGSEGIKQRFWLAKTTKTPIFLRKICSYM